MYRLERENGWYNNEAVQKPACTLVIKKNIWTRLFLPLLRGRVVKRLYYRYSGYTIYYVWPFLLLLLSITEMTSPSEFIINRSLRTVCICLLVVYTRRTSLTHRGVEPRTHGNFPKTDFWRGRVSENRLRNGFACSTMTRRERWKEVVPSSSSCTRRAGTIRAMGSGGPRTVICI